MRDELIDKIKNGTVDVNNSEIFFGLVIKGAIWKMNQLLQLRGKPIPHMIISTGDDIMYKEMSGYMYCPTEQTGEDHIYMQVPRCIVGLSGISSDSSQLSNKHIYGNFEMSDDDGIYSLTAPFKRVLMDISLDLKYTVDSFTDSLSLMQMLFTNLLTIKTYKIDYMGFTIECSMSFEKSDSADYNVDVDFGEDDRNKTISLGVSIETNFPIFNTKKIQCSGDIISSAKLNDKKVY